MQSILTGYPAYFLTEDQQHLQLDSEHFSATNELLLCPRTESGWAEPGIIAACPDVEAPQEDVTVSEGILPVSVACSTEPSGFDIDNLIVENKNLKAECNAPKAEICQKSTVVDFEDEQAVSSLTGVTSSKFILLLQVITASYAPPFGNVIPYAQQLLVVLMKIRLGLLNKIWL